MDTGYENIKRLIIGHLLGELTPDSERELRYWRNEKPEHEALFNKVSDQARLSGKLAGYGATDTEKALLTNRALLRRRANRKNVRRIVRYAAVLVLAVAAWFAADLFKGPADTEEHAIEAGKKQAELILQDGSVYLLDEGIDKEIADNETIIHISDNRVLYRDDTAGGTTEYHTIRTPHGGEYTVTLSDGTQVWLNAMSELRYPRHFNGETREVTFRGEAYFEVSKSDRPFIVAANDCNVTVLGTSFNITAYPEEQYVLTTLCTGKVEVADTAFPADVRIITPGEQLAFNRRSRDMSVSRVDTDIFTAWTRGRFQYDNNTVEEVFNVLKRWYVIEVVYDNERVKQEVFTGVLPRFSDLQMILDVMEKVSDLRFEVRGNTVTVK